MIRLNSGDWRLLRQRILGSNYCNEILTRFAEINFAHAGQIFGIYPFRSIMRLGLSDTNKAWKKRKGLFNTKTYCKVKIYWRKRSLFAKMFLNLISAKIIQQQRCIPTSQKRSFIFRIYKRNTFPTAYCNSSCKYRFHKYIKIYSILQFWENLKVSFSYFLSLRNLWNFDKSMKFWEIWEILRNLRNFVKFEKFEKNISHGSLSTSSGEPLGRKCRGKCLTVAL